MVIGDVKNKITAGAPGYLMQTLQVKQNTLMRIITNKKWQQDSNKLVSTKELLQSCNWMSVRQLGVLAATTQIQNIMMTKEPRALFNKLTNIEQPRTRQTETRKHKKPTIPIPNLESTWKTWKWRAVSQYNTYPLRITNSRMDKSEC